MLFGSNEKIDLWYYLSHWFLQVSLSLIGLVKGYLLLLNFVGSYKSKQLNFSFDVLICCYIKSHLRRYVLYALLPLSLVKGIRPILGIRVGFIPWDSGNTFVVHANVYILNTVLLAGCVELKAKCDWHSQ